MTIQSMFPEQIEEVLARLSDGCVDVILQNLNELPTCSQKLAEKITELQNILKENPELADAMREETKEIFNVEHMRMVTQAFVKDTNEFMQGYRILCVTTEKTSERMWEDYAQDHEGIALRITPNVEKASKFELFRSVTYAALRPALYDETFDFLKGCWFGDHEARSRAMLDKIIYAKTLRYKFEREYRLAIPSGEDGDWNTLPYHPEEITELYLGLAMKKLDKDDIVTKAKAVNPKIAVFQGSRDANKKLTFNQM